MPRRAQRRCSDAVFLMVPLNSATRPWAQEKEAPREFKWDATWGVAMQHQLSNSNASTTISPVKPSPIGNRASVRLARFAETEAPCAMKFKRALDFSNAQTKASEQIRLVETALRAAAQRSAPQASSGAEISDRQLSAISRRTPSVDAQRFRKSRTVAIISFAVVLPSLVGVAVWLNIIQLPLADVSQKSQSIPSPVLTAPALLEATAGESIFLPIALDGTDGVPADSTIAVTGLPQGTTLSKGRPFGDTGWKLERDEIGDLQLVLSGSAGGQTKLAIELVAPDATVVADAEILLQVVTAPQDSLQRIAEATDTATLAAAKPDTALSGMTIPAASPEIADAQPTHEDPQGQPDLDLREAKPSAAATKREEEPVQAEPRAPIKRTVAIVGANEVKTSLFVNLRQAPSPSAKVIRVVAKGTKLRVVARKGRWVQVTDPATSANGWIYTGNENAPPTKKPSAPAEQSEDTQPKPDSGDAQPKPDSVWPSFLRGGLASG
jgi:Bacterial SH3 domain